MSEPPAWAAPGQEPPEPPAHQPRPPDTGWLPDHPRPGTPPRGWDAPAAGQSAEQPGFGGAQPGWGGAQPGWGGGQPGEGGGQRAWGQPRAIEPQPGVIPLRPLGLGELLDGAIAIVRSYPRVTLGLSAVVMTITQLIQLAVSASFLPDLGQLGTDVNTATPDAGEIGSFLGALGAVLVTNVVITGLGVLVLTGMLTVVVGKAVLGEPITTRQVWAELRPQLLRLVGVSLLTGLIISAVAVACLVPAVVAAVANVPGVVTGLVVGGALAGLVLGVTTYVQLSLATPALVLERQSVRGALRRSRLLVRHSWWRVAGILVLAAMVAAVLNGILSLPLSILGGGRSAFGLSAPSAGVGFGALLLTAIGAIIAGTIVQPFNAGVQALLYVDRRMRAEGLDVTLVQAAAQRGAPVT